MVGHLGFSGPNDWELAFQIWKSSSLDQTRSLLINENTLTNHWAARYKTLQESHFNCFILVLFIQLEVSLPE